MEDVGQDVKRCIIYGKYRSKVLKGVSFDASRHSPIKRKEIFLNS